MPTFEKPSVADLRHAADQLGMNPSMMYLNAVQDVVAPLCAAYAALVAAGEVPMAIGGDQAGSIRIPAAHCGIVGMKPTFGLVPYTGIGPLEITLDTAGPMTANVADNALLLEVLAGPDGLDARQHGAQVGRYTEALDGGTKGLRIGVLREGFSHRNSEPDVDA